MHIRSLRGGCGHTRRLRRIRVTAVVVAVALVEVLLVPSVVAAAPVMSCRGTYTAVTLAGPLDVAAGNVCTLVNVTVGGSGQVSVEGQLVADNSTFGGAVVANGGATLVLNGGTVEANLTVSGPGTTVDLNGATVGASLNISGPGVKGEVICPVGVGGAFSLDSAAVSVTGAGCTFGAAAKVTNVPMGTPESFAGASVNGAMLVMDNQTEVDLGPLTINGALVCQHNVVPPVNVGGLSAKNFVGQCAGGPGTPRPPGVSGPLASALLSLAPAASGPLVVGGHQALTATLTSSSGPLAGQPITFSAQGANPATGSATTNAQGVATFTDNGNAAGTDHVVASAASPGGTIYSNAATVTWVSLANASLALTPANVPDDVVGTTQVMTATLSTGGQPIAHQAVAFAVSGANSATGSATTNSAGVATFAYTGANVGTDSVVATSTGGGSTVTSLPSHIGWVTAGTAQGTNPEGASMGPVQGNFFAEPATAESFVAAPGDTPAFGQTFPDIAFDPPTGTVLGEPASGPNPSTRPFTDVTTDEAGGFTGTIPAGANGFAAGQATGAGNLTTFDAVFTGSLNVAKAETLTLQVIADDGFLLGVGGGASAVSPSIVGTTVATTPFQGYPLDGAWDTEGPGGPGTYQVTVTFPAAGTYPYELDYFSCCDHTESLTLGVVNPISVPTEPYNLYTGYADNTRPGTGAGFPNPWQGAPGTTFDGSGSPYDTGGLRFDNTGSKPLTLSNVTVDIGTNHYGIWNWPKTVQPGSTLILSGTGGNFDTSETDVANGSADTFTVATGYADCPVANPGCNGSVATNPNFPSPWYASPDTQFVGDPAVANLAQDSDPDEAAIKIANDGTTALTVNDVNVVGCGSSTLDLWGAAPNAYPYTVQPGQNLILSSTNGDNFDGSDLCGYGSEPAINVTVNGVQHSYVDNVANGGKGAIGGTACTCDESTPWSVLGISAFALTATGGAKPATGATGTRPTTGATGATAGTANRAKPSAKPALPGGPAATQRSAKAQKAAAAEKATAKAKGQTHKRPVSRPTTVKPTGTTAPRPSAVTNGAPGGGTGENGFATQAFATGFSNNGSIGPIGLVFDANGNLDIGDYNDGNLYRFGPSGGDAASNKVSATPIGGTLAGLTFSKSGRLYAIIQNQVRVVELDPTTGAIIRTVEQGHGTCDIATDPLSGDLFVTDCNSQLWRISNFENGGPVTTTLYGPGGDGFVFGPDGTIFQSTSWGGIVELSGTNKPQPASVTHITNGGPGPIDGIALFQPPTGQPVTKLAVNRNDGVITEVDFSNPASPVLTDIVSGGTRGDFVTTGSDGCLYATQTSIVEKVTSSDGTCPFVPVQTCTPSLVVPMVHVTVNGDTVTYPDPRLALTAGGKDGEACGTNESEPWTQVAGTSAVNVMPLPPSVSLTLSPALSLDNVVGTAQTLEVSVTDQAGHPADAIGVTVAISGAKPQTLTATTDATGTVALSYTGANAGSDTASASALVAGAAAFSNQATIGWTIPVPPPPPPPPAGQAPPSVEITSPTNGQQLLAATPVDAVMNPPAVSPIASWTVTAQPAGGGAAIPVASGTGAPPAQLGAIDPTTLAVGTYSVVVTATTAAGAQASAAVSVLVGTGVGTGGGGGGGGGTGGGTAAQAPPSISGVTPADGSIVTEPSPVTASITAPAGESIVSWSAAFHPASSPVLTSLGSGSGAPPATVGTFDPTLLPDDTYLIQVTAITSGGGSATETSSVAVTGALKPGRYVTTFGDLSVPVSGFSASVGRTYDSYDKAVGDFGVGWTLSASNYKVSVNAPLGQGGWTAQPTSCGLFGCQYAYVSSVPHYATVTFPDGHQEVFNFTPNGGFGPFYFLGSSAFTRRPGTQTTSTLAVDPTTDPGVSFGFDGNLDSGIEGAVYNPTRFVLTLSTGTKLMLDESTGLVSETDPHSNVVTFDASGIHATNAAGTAEPGVAYTRDTQGRITKVTGPSGQTLAYAYDAAGNLASVVDPVGNTTTFTYDNNHDLLKTTGPGGPLNTYSYDASGRLVSITDGQGHVTNVANNVGASQQVLTDPLGKLTDLLTFDTSGNVISTQAEADGVSRTTSQTFDTLGDVTSKVDPLGNSSFAIFDAQGNQTSATDPTGAVSSSTFGPMDEALTRTNPLGQTTSASYDGSGGLTTLTRPDGSTVQTGYDANGNPNSITDELGNVTNAVFTATGQPATVTDPLGHTVTDGYDSSGNRTSITTPDGHATTAYDGDNRAVSTTDPLGDVTRSAYDGLGDVASTTNANGNTTSYSYNSSQQETGITDAAGGTVGFTHDADGRQISTTDPDGHTEQFTYDDFGDQTGITAPQTGTTTSTFDADGRLVSVTDGRGITVTSSYDAAGRLTGQTAAGFTSVRTYDAAGHLASVVDPTGATSYTYDVNGRVTAVASPEGTIGYTYDAAGNRTSMTLPQGKVTYGYDADNNLTGESTSGQTISFTYNADNLQSTVSRSNGVTTTYGYDAAGRTSSVVSTNGPTTLSSFAYTRDPDGNPTAVATPSGTTTYAYDKLDRLLANTGGTPPAQSFTYDAAGNLTSTTTGATVTTYTHNAAGQLSAVGSTPVASDGAGDVTQIGSQRFGYDAYGRLTSATTGGTTSANTYDANNLRVATTAPATTDLWDQVDPSTGQLASTAHLASDGTNVFLTANGQTQAQVAGGTATYYLPDALGTVQGTTAAPGTLAGGSTYSDYGQQTATTGAAVPFGFTGQSQDPTGLVYLRARYLDPAIGQFLSPDGVQPNAAGTTGYNRYSYAADNPTTLTDPSGHAVFAEDFVILRSIQLFIAGFLAGYFFGMGSICGGLAGLAGAFGAITVALVTRLLGVLAGILALLKLFLKC